MEESQLCLILYGVLRGITPILNIIGCMWLNHSNAYNCREHVEESQQFLIL